MCCQTYTRGLASPQIACVCSRACQASTRPITTAHSDARPSTPVRRQKGSRKCSRAALRQRRTAAGHTGYVLCKPRRRLRSISRSSVGHGGRLAAIATLARRCRMRNHSCPEVCMELCVCANNGTWFQRPHRLFHHQHCRGVRILHLIDIRRLEYQRQQCDSPKPEHARPAPNP